MTLESCRFERKLADLWVGVFWKKEVIVTLWRGSEETERSEFLHVWICIVPCFPLHICWRTN